MRFQEYIVDKTMTFEKALQIFKINALIANDKLALKRKYKSLMENHKEDQDINDAYALLSTAKIVKSNVKKWGIQVESKMGKLPEKIERTAWLERDMAMGRYDPTELQWQLVNSSTDDDRRNYTMIQDIAWKELKKMQRKKILDFMDDAFNVSMMSGGGNKTYQAEVKLFKYDLKPLMAELRKLKFKVYK